MRARAQPMAECQNCFIVTHRRCSVCHVCHYCSEECEETADKQCNARVSCALHKRLERELFDSLRPDH